MFVSEGHQSVAYGISKNDEGIYLSLNSHNENPQNPTREDLAGVRMRKRERGGKNEGEGNKKEGTMEMRG